MPEEMTPAQGALKKGAVTLATARAIREVCEKYREEIQARAKELLPTVAQELLDEAERGKAEL